MTANTGIQAMLPSTRPAWAARQAGSCLTLPSGRSPAAGVDKLALTWLLACSGWALGAAQAATQPRAPQIATDVTPTAQAAHELVRAAASQTPQARLATGLQHAQAGQWDLAETHFRDLVRDHPGWADAQNNLAAVLAARGDLEGARYWLETAIRSEPGFASAHHNLGDTYLRLATLSYERAVQLDRSRAELASRLATLQAWHDGATTRVATPGAATHADAAVKPTTARATVPHAVPIGKPAPGDTPTPDEPELAQDRLAVTGAVEAWAEAWSRRDVDAYLQAYEPDYTPTGVQRSTWEQGRAARIQSRAQIQLSLQNLRVSLDGDVALVRFRQHYRSDVHSSVDEKVLQLRRNSAGGWLIARELARKASPQVAQPILAQARTTPPVAAPVQQPAATAVALKAQEPPAKPGLAAEAPEAEQVREALKRWARTLKGRDLGAFVANYAADYAPAGMTRAAWLQQHQTRIRAHLRTDVRLEDIRVAVDGTQARVAFRQNYRSGSVQASDDKVLWLQRQADGRWLIVREAVGRVTLEATQSPM
jgi:ketosteroid isomerase-like protein